VRAGFLGESLPAAGKYGRFTGCAEAISNLSRCYLRLIWIYPRLLIAMCPGFIIVRLYPRFFLEMVYWRSYFIGGRCC